MQTGAGGSDDYDFIFIHRRHGKLNPLVLHFIFYNLSSNESMHTRMNKL